MFSWLLFRATSWGQLRAFVHGLLSFTGGTVLHPIYYGVLGLACLTHFTPEGWADRALECWQGTSAPLQGVFYAALILLLCGLTLGAPSFIYFQF